jgi:hypothetical protein
MLLQFAEAKGDLNVGVAVAAAGFEQQDCRALIISQTMRQDTSGRSGANDDLIVTDGVVHNCSPVFSVGPPT